MTLEVSIIKSAGQYFDIPEVTPPGRTKGIAIGAFEALQRVFSWSWEDVVSLFRHYTDDQKRVVELAHGEQLSLSGKDFDLLARILTTPQFDHLKGEVEMILSKAKSEQINTIIDKALALAVAEDKEFDCEIFDLIPDTELQGMYGKDPEEVLRTIKNTLRSRAVRQNADKNFIWRVGSQTKLLLSRLIELFLSIALRVTGTGRASESGNVSQLDLPNKLLLSINAFLALGQKIPLLKEIPYGQQILWVSLIGAIVIFLASPLLARIESHFEPCPTQIVGFENMGARLHEGILYRDDLIGNVCTRLTRGEKILLRGPTGVGKKTVAEGVVQRFLTTEDPFSEGKTFFSFSFEEGVDREEILRRFVESTEHHKENLVVFIDRAEIGLKGHSLALKAIYERYPHVILSSSLDGRDEPTLENFHAIPVEQLDKEKVLLIMRKYLEEKHPEEEFSNEVLQAILDQDVDWTLANPAKALHVLAQYMTNNRVRGKSVVVEALHRYKELRDALLAKGADNYDEFTDVPDDAMAWVWQENREWNSWDAGVVGSGTPRKISLQKRIFDAAIDRLEEEQKESVRTFDRLRRARVARLHCKQIELLLIRKFDPKSLQPLLARRWRTVEVIRKKLEGLIEKSLEETKDHRIETNAAMARSFTRRRYPSSLSPSSLALPRPVSAPPPLSIQSVEGSVQSPDTE